MKAQGKIDIAVAMVKDAADTLRTKLECTSLAVAARVYYFEFTLGVYNELQCGSYAFMDADYGRILDKDGKRIDQGELERDVYLTSAMSLPKRIKPSLMRAKRCNPPIAACPMADAMMWNTSNVQTNMAL